MRAWGGTRHRKLGIAGVLAAGKGDLADEGLLLDGGISEKGAHGGQEEVIGWRFCLSRLNPKGALKRLSQRGVSWALR